VRDKRGRAGRWGGGTAGTTVGEGEVTSEQGMGGDPVCSYLAGVMQESAE